jgi:hypothetical protein
LWQRIPRGWACVSNLTPGDRAIFPVGFFNSGLERITLRSTEALRDNMLRRKMAH